MNSWYYYMCPLGYGNKANIFKLFIIEIKRSEIREVAYIYKYTSGHLILTLQSITMAELGIKCPLVHLQVYIGNLYCFTTFSMIPNRT